jgi:hypothetical protein
LQAHADASRILFRERRCVARANIHHMSATGLDALLEPLSRCLDAESARRVVEFQIEPPVQQRIERLAEGANEGALSAGEHSEYEALINAADFISILKLKARQRLDSTTE